MDDARIVELFWQRDEAALAETEAKYGSYCLAIAKGILRDAEDAKECVNDTWLATWNAIPPHRPDVLSTFVGKITRRLSLKKFRDKSADKRGGNAVEESIDEMEDCFPADMRIDEKLDAEELGRLINAFLDTLPADERRVFLRRYWFFDSVADIATRYRFGQSKVKMILKRTRDKLMVCLQKEGVWV